VVIEEMLRKGYSIFVETTRPGACAALQPERMAYVITELAPGIEPAPGC